MWEEGGSRREHHKGERVSELRCREIIDIATGRRFGYVGDMEVDLETGQATALVVPGRRRFFGLLGREEDHRFPWETVRRFGEDIILVECEKKKLQDGRSMGREKVRFRED